MSMISKKEIMKTILEKKKRKSRKNARKMIAGEEWNKGGKWVE